MKKAESRDALCGRRGPGKRYDCMDKEEFTRRLLQSEQMLYRIARTLLSSDADCADAVQEAVANAWQHRDTLREEAYFQTWLTRILINACRTQQRRMRRLVPVAQLPERYEAPPPDPGVREALFALPPALRLPTVLNYIEGFSMEEIARSTRTPVGTVKYRLYQARRRLRLEIQPDAAMPIGERSR